jgi:tetratricopeptide (TPR) repeat protein
VTRNGESRGRDHGANEKATPERAQVLEEEAADLFANGGFTEARGLYEHCLRIYRKLSKRDNEAQTLTRIAQCYEAEADYKEARTYYEEAIALYRASKHPLGPSDALRTLGTSALERGNFTFASKLLRECSEICEKEGYQESYTISLFLLAAADMLEGDVANSRVLQTRAERSSGFARESLGLAEATIRFAKAVILSQPCCTGACSVSD